MINPPPPTLRDKVGPRVGNFDADAIARAEEALKAMSVNFHDWMAREAGRLDAARQAARDSGYSEKTLEALYLCAHDVKGLAGTYDYQLCTDIAGPLCRLIETHEARADAAKHAALIDAHVDAIKAVARDRIQNASNPVGRALATALRAKVESLLGPE